MLKLDPTLCQWIEGDPLANGRQCNARRGAGRSYCPEHHARAYLPPRSGAASVTDPWQTPREAA